MAAIKTLCLTSLFLIVSRISALQTGSDSKTACESSDVTIDFIFNIGNDSFAERLWYKNSIIPANRIARVVGAGPLTVESQYSGRVALSGSRGIILYNATKTDSGSYLFIIVTDIYSELGTATTTVNVYVNPNDSCMPLIEKYSADKYTCKISDACPGKDSIQAIWDDDTVGAITCPSTTKNKYKCSAKGDPVTYCNSSGGLCKDIECNATTPTVRETSTTTASTTGDITSTTTASTTEDIISTTTATPSMNSTSTTNGNQLVIIISVSVSAAVLVILIICCCLHHRRKRKKKQTKHKTHNDIARNGSKLTNEQNKLHNVTNTSQVDSSFDVNKVPKTKSDKGNSNAKIQSSTRI